MNLIDATNCIKFFEIGAALVGLLYFKNLRGTFWLYLPLFLVVLFSLECYAQWLAANKNYTANVTLYKLIVVPALFGFYSFIFYNILEKKRPLLMGIGIALFVGSLILEYTVLKSLHPFYASLSLGIANIFFLIYCILYYVELINSERLITFYKSLSFWFCTGILIFYLGCLPYFGLYNILATKFHKTIFLPYTWVFIVLNYIMYSLFMIGFIWSRKR